MTTQNLTIKDLVGIHRSFTDEYTIIEIVRETSTDSYCALLEQQIDDPSEEVDLSTAIECLMCKLDEYCFFTLWSCELELHKDVSSHISWLQSSAAKKLKKSGVSHEDLMRIRHIRRSYDALNELLDGLQLDRIASYREYEYADDENVNAILEEVAYDNRMGSSDYFIVPLSFYEPNLEIRLPSSNVEFSRDEELKYVLSVRRRPKAERIDQSYKLNLPESNDWRVVKWTKTIWGTEVWVEKNDCYGQYLIIITPGDPTS